MAIARYGDVQVARKGVQVLTELLRNQRISAEAKAERDNSVLVAAAESGLYLDPDMGDDLLTQYRDANRIRNDFGTMGEDGLKGFLNPLEKAQLDPYPSSIGKQEQNNALEILDSMLKNDPRTEVLKEQTFGDIEGSELEFAINNARVGLQANKTFKTPTEETSYHVAQLASARPRMEDAVENINRVKDAFENMIITTETGEAPKINIKEIAKKTEASLKRQLGNKEYKAFIDSYIASEGMDSGSDEDDIFTRVAQQLFASKASDFVEMIYGRPDMVLEYIGDNPTHPIDAGIRYIAESADANGNLIFPTAMIARTMLDQSNLLNDMNVLSEYYNFTRYEDIIEGDKIRASVDYMYKQSTKTQGMVGTAKHILQTSPDD